jgi:hypothetical protein
MLCFYQAKNFEPGCDEIRSVRVRGSRGGAESPRGRDQYPQSVYFTFERHWHYEDFIDLHLTGAGRTDTPLVAPLYTWLTCSACSPTSRPQQSLWGRHLSFATLRDHACSSLLVLTWTCLSFLYCDVSHFISVYRTSCLV